MARRWARWLSVAAASVAFAVMPLAGASAPTPAAAGTFLDNYTPDLSRTCPLGSVNSQAVYAVHARSHASPVGALTDSLWLSTRHRTTAARLPLCVRLSGLAGTLRVGTNAGPSMSKRAVAWTSLGYDTRIDLTGFSPVGDTPADATVRFGGPAGDIEVASGHLPEVQDYTPTAGAGPDVGTVGNGEGTHGSLVILDVGDSTSLPVSFSHPGIYDLAFSASQWRGEDGWMVSNGLTVRVVVLPGGAAEPAEPTQPPEPPKTDERLDPIAPAPTPSPAPVPTPTEPEAPAPVAPTVPVVPPPPEPTMPSIPEPAPAPTPPAAPLPIPVAPIIPVVPIEPSDNVPPAVPDTRPVVPLQPGHTPTPPAPPAPKKPEVTPAPKKPEVTPAPPAPTPTGPATPDRRSDSTAPTQEREHLPAPALPRELTGTAPSPVDSPASSRPATQAPGTTPTGPEPDSPTADTSDQARTPSSASHLDSHTLEAVPRVHANDIDAQASTVRWTHTASSTVLVTGFAVAGAATSAGLVMILRGRP